MWFHVDGNEINPLYRLEFVSESRVAWAPLLKPTNLGEMVPPALVLLTSAHKAFFISTFTKVGEDDE